MEIGTGLRNSTLLEFNIFKYNDAQGVSITFFNVFEAHFKSSYN